MTSDTNLQFIREKVGQLRSAVMYATANGPVKIENDIVTAISVDSEGQLWFMANHPPCHADEDEQSFSARLRFYRKGLDFFMEISGKATVVSNDCAFTDDTNGSKSIKRMLVKMAMMNVEYTEPHAKKPKSKMELLMNEWYTRFLRIVSVEHQQGSVLKKLRQTN